MNTSIKDDIKELQKKYNDISGNIENYRDMMIVLDKETNPNFKNLLNNVNKELNNKKVKVRNDQYKERQKIYDEIIKKIYDDKEYEKKEYYKNDTNNNICKVPYFITKKRLDHNPRKKRPYYIANSTDQDLLLYNSHNITFEDLSGSFKDIMKPNKDYYGIKKKNNIDEFNVLKKNRIDLENIYINNTIEKMLIDKKSGNTPATPANPDTSNNNTISGGGIYSINESCNNKLVSVLTVKDPRLDLINLKMDIINYIEYIKDIRIQFNKKYRELVQEKMKNLKKRKFLIKQLNKFSKGGYLKTKKSKKKKSKTKKIRYKKNKKTKKQKK